MKTTALLDLTRKTAIGLLAGYLLFFSAGIPMVTFLCGTGDVRTECRMSGCDGSEPLPPSPSLSGPACCEAQIVRSDMRSAVISEPFHSLIAIAPVVPFQTDVPALFDNARGASVPDRQALHPPLFLLNSSLLI